MCPWLHASVLSGLSFCSPGLTTTVRLMLLTLAMPTYNRADCLRSTPLASLAEIKQHGLQDVIEVVV